MELVLLGVQELFPTERMRRQVMNVECVTRNRWRLGYCTLATVHSVRISGFERPAVATPAVDVDPNQFSFGSAQHGFFGRALSLPSGLVDVPKTQSIFGVSHLVYGVVCSMLARGRLLSH
ncbi:hypothetical protein MSAN_02343400 [Mycena sanguinolenta]|uniref:Uncharacterized protein n=1 Tax=Mycena sanguinolenta TaxID=230812 RepID=A0A8H6X7B6_9AGAR|nr:hypothetical protein MSAN_02343400 [Mycena sanguinolenta]